MLQIYSDQYIQVMLQVYSDQYIHVMLQNFQASLRFRFYSLCCRFLQGSYYTGYLFRVQYMHVILQNFQGLYPRFIQGSVYTGNAVDLFRIQFIQTILQVYSFYHTHVWARLHYIICFVRKVINLKIYRNYPVVLLNQSKVDTERRG